MEKFKIPLVIKCDLTNLYEKYNFKRNSVTRMQNICKPEKANIRLQQCFIQITITTDIKIILIS